MQHFLKTCSTTVSGIFFQDTDTHFANFNAYVLAQPFFWLTTIVRYILILDWQAGSLPLVPPGMPWAHYVWHLLC